MIGRGDAKTKFHIGKQTMEYINNEVSNIELEIIFNLNRINNLNIDIIYSKQYIIYFMG